MQESNAGAMMEAGRELDALVAEKVMGWSKRVSADHSNSPIKQLRAFGIIYAWKDSNGNDKGLDVPRYSTDIAAAWQVVERLRDQWTEATEGMQLVDDFPRPFDDQTFFEVLHRNADRRWPWAMLYMTPASICIAALKAVGVLE